MVAAEHGNTSQVIRAAVREYFTLLQAELGGRRWWLSGRSGAFRNHFLNDVEGRSLWQGQISAVLIAHGLPYLSRIRPRRHFEPALSDAVRTYLYNHPKVFQLMEQDVFRRIDAVPPVEDTADIVVPPPAGDEIPRLDPDLPRSQLLAGVDFLACEQRNHSLATAGQQFVFAFEQVRLGNRGMKAHASSVEHVMDELGDAPGYAIHSYGNDGSDRFIEVKTTCYGRETPFYVSEHEVAMSNRYGDRFWIYRVFAFRDQPRLYMLNGPLEQATDLEPTEYRSTPR